MDKVEFEADLRREGYRVVNTSVKPNPDFSPNQVHWGMDSERLVLQPQFFRFHRTPQC
jgi:hypothetical protein